MAQRRSARFVIDDVSPANDPAWTMAGPDVRRAFWRAVVAYGIKAHDRQQAAGLDRFGRTLVPIKASTRKHRDSAMGPADPNAPPLTPAYGVSRTRLNLTGRAFDDRAEFYWTDGWGRILLIHARGSRRRGLPVRDVIGLSPDSMRLVRNWALGWWLVHKRTGAPPVAKVKATAPGALVQDGTDDYRRFTFGIGTTADQEREARRAERLFAAGRSTGFRQRVIGEGPPRPPQGPLPTPPPKPPTPKPVRPPTPLERIQAALEEQRKANAVEAAARPVVVEAVETSNVRVWRGEVKRLNRERDAAVKEGKKAAKVYPKLKAELDEAEAKQWDYSLSRETRDKWEKKADQLRIQVFMAQSNTGESLQKTLDYHDKQIAVAEETLAKAMAAPEAAREYRYADALADVPNLLPRGPVAERIKAYRVGDLKAETVAATADRAVGLRQRAVAESDRMKEQFRAIAEKQAATADHYIKNGLPIPPEVEAELDRLGDELERLLKKQRENNARKEARLDRINRATRNVVQKVLAAGNPLPFRHADVPAGYSSSDGPLSTLTTKTRDNVKAAQQWLASVMESGGNAPITTKIGERAGARAHFSNSRDHIQAKTGESIDVVVHEYGHAIDYRVTTAGDPVVKRSLEFLAHRVGDEATTDMRRKFGTGDPGEKGRKDKFESVFNEYSAYYTGKDYGQDATEIVSMGLQLLYDDPIKFAKGDPEFFKFIVGVLDGSLR